MALLASLDPHGAVGTMGTASSNVQATGAATMLPKAATDGGTAAYKAADAAADAGAAAPSIRTDSVVESEDPAASQVGAES